jgi:methylmalonyl-CoA/ethylmalonyl-CoA epimerase
MNFELRHVGHVVENLERALQEYRDVLDLEPADDGTGAEEGARSALLPIGDLFIELVEPGRGGGRARAFLEEKGEGLYCLGLASRDGVDAWIDPESTCGAPIRIVCEREGLRPRERRGGRAARACISHIGHAVRSTAAAEDAYARVLGVRRRFSLDLAELQVHSTMIALGSHHSELLEPTGDKGPIRKFLQTRGEGLYHVCLAVADSDAEIALLKARGIRVLEIPATRELPGKTAWFRLAGVSFEVAPESLLSHLEATGSR